MRFSEQFIEDLRDRISISDVVGSRAVWDRKKTRPARGDFWACCPFHGENSPSFHCQDKSGRYHCFGCGASGDCFRFFVDLDGVSFPRAVEMVASLAGLSLPDRPETAMERREREDRAKERSAAQVARARLDEAEQRRKAETVRGIWADSVAIAGTLAEKYLLGRGVAPMQWPASLRFHAGLALGRGFQPALVCGVQNAERALVAVWRIFLTTEGKAAVGDDGRKVKLGLGPAGGGAVRLGPASEEINVCEGVETGFGVGCLTTWKHPVWPLLSTSGMIAWEPPAGVKRVGIFADGDRYKVNQKTGNIAEPPGRVAALKLQEKLKAKGIASAIHEPRAGADWLDVWNTLRNDQERERGVVYPD